MSRKVKGSDFKHPCLATDCQYNDWNGRCGAYTTGTIDGKCAHFTLLPIGELIRRSCWECHKENEHLKTAYGVYHCARCNRFFKNGVFVDHVNLEIKPKECYDDTRK